MGMKLQKAVMILALFTSVACAAPQYTETKLRSEVSVLTTRAPDLSSQPKFAKTLSGNFRNDLAKAVISSPKYISASSALDSSKSQIVVANADSELQFSANVNAGQTIKDGNGLASSSEYGASANITVSQLIFDGGATAAKIDQAQVNAFIAEMDMEIAANQVAKDAAISWVELDALRRREAQLQTLMTKTDKMISQMETLVASGMIDKSASASAEIAARALSVENSNLGSQIAARSADYIEFFGTIPQKLATPLTLLNPKDVARIKRDWRHAPILAQAAANVLAAKQGLIAAQGREKPAVGFKAGMVSPIERDERTTYAVGMEVTWILGDGGRRKANTDAQAANLRAMEQKLKGAKLGAKRELDTTISKRAALIASLQTLSLQEEASQNELEIMRSQLATGQTSVRQLIQVEEKAYRTSDQKITLESALLKIDFEMLANSGLLTKRLGIYANNKNTKAAK
jgi:outer membrane protein, adhesin transport system